MTRTISQIPIRDFEARLRTSGIYLRTGPFLYCLRTDVPGLANSISQLYADFPIPDPSSTRFADFRVSLLRTGPIPVLSRSCRFQVAGGPTAVSVPRMGALATLEWGLNSCIYQHGQLDMILHAAVVERNGQALVLVGASGSGKSTLCAALAFNGWRLLSDELALVSTDDYFLTPIARPLILKAQSIEVVRQVCPSAVFGPQVPNTAKGTVAHMRPPRDSVLRMDERATPRSVIFVNFQAGARAELRHVTKGKALLRLSESSFNAGILGRIGFDTLVAIVDQCRCVEMTYGNLTEALALVCREIDPPSPVTTATADGGPRQGQKR